MTNFLAISEARNNLPKVVNKIYENMDRVVITVNGKPKAVVLSPEELESIEETAEILAIPGALESIKRSLKDAKAGRVIPLSELK